MKPNELIKGNFYKRVGVRPFTDYIFRYDNSTGQLLKSTGMVGVESDWFHKKGTTGADADVCTDVVEATEEEKEWLLLCIQHGKRVPKPEDYSLTY